MTNAPDTWRLGDRTFTSRLLVGTGKYSSNDETRAALAASGAEIVTVALRRVDLKAPDNVLTAMFGGQLTLMLEALDDALPPPMRFGFSVDATQEWLDRLLPLVAQHDLEHLVTMTGYADQRWRLRLLW